ncbi:MAG: addiction module component CHP02574 family protein [Bacteroidetes bacterium 4484_276]|nr:MAG: addiction module component CHP02574 family protein [Bacteroidetes bacterium 4484_276]OYT13196.1 MAG: addiction module component CHP02574 family protein [Bacteroidetes bacterium 4572_114]
MNTAEINKMPIKDRIILMEEIWNTLRKENIEIESSEWHGEILTDRRKKIEEGNANYISIDELKTNSQ